MDSLKVICILLLPVATGVEAEVPVEVVGGQVRALAGVPEEVAVTGVDRPVEAWEGPEKTGSLFRLTRTSTCTVWERISIQLPR
mgnify:CR=1 FL=1